MLLFSSGKPKRWLSLIMSILMVNTVLITSLPSKSLVAALENDPGSSVPENSMACEIVDFRALFDQLDQKGVIGTRIPTMKRGILLSGRLM